MLPMQILQILRHHTDERHPLTQQQIIGLLKTEYGTEVERKAVSRNLTNLMEMGFEIERDNGIYLAGREFEDSELRLLIDSLLFSGHLPGKQRRELIEKLKGLGSKYFDAKVKHVRTLPEESLANRQIFYTVEVLDEAISLKRQVSFMYNSYGLDRKLHPRREEAYLVNPYQMVAAGGHYYLICNYDKYDRLDHYRLDRMTEIKMLDTPAKPLREVTGSTSLDLPKHMAEHIYMFAGESLRVTFRAKKAILNDVMDWFGTQASFSNGTEETFDVSVLVNRRAMFCWALQYGPHVEVLEPEELREEIRCAVKEMMERYRPV